ncbi:MAG: mercury transporter MerT [Proteobacteria bacterium]|nr:mercury transporter MerT [Pseudomonadota bacterium]
MKSALLAIGGLFGAAGASACCVMPLVLVVAGVGGPWLGSLTSLAPYQPYFAGASLLFLGFGFLQVYGRKRKFCLEDGDCGTEKSQRFVKFILWAGTGLVLLSLFVQQILPLVIES